MDPVTAYSILCRYFPMQGMIWYNPTKPMCAFCGYLTHCYATLNGIRKKRKAASAIDYWKPPMCYSCWRAVRIFRSALRWLHTLSPDDVRILWAKGYFHWACYYVQYTAPPRGLPWLTDCYVDGDRIAYPVVPYD